MPVNAAKQPKAPGALPRFPRRLQEPCGIASPLCRVRKRSKQQACILLLICFLASHAHAGTASELQEAIGKNRVRVDLVLQGADADDATTRRLAATAIGKWHQHVPGAIVCLRRLAHDRDASVAVAAVVAAANIGTHEAVACAVDTINRLGNLPDTEITPVQAGRLADALDQPSVRPFWRESDQFGIRRAVAELSKLAVRTHTEKSLSGLRFVDTNQATVSASRIQAGRQAFMTAHCDACHRVAGYGQAIAPDLRGVGQCYDNLELLRHILEPSLDIHDAGRQHQVLTHGGELLTGIVTRTETRIGIRPLPKLDASPGSESTTSPTRWLSLKEIDAIKPLPVSPMPRGLLNALTPTEIADLVLFLRTDGGSSIQPAPSGHHH